MTDERSDGIGWLIGIGLVFGAIGVWEIYNLVESHGADVLVWIAAFPFALLVHRYIFGERESLIKQWRSLFNGSATTPTTPTDPSESASSELPDSSTGLSTAEPGAKVEDGDREQQPPKDADP